MNFITQGFGIGRWFGIQVTISWLFVLYIAEEFMGGGPQDPMQTRLHVIEVVLLFATVLMHEFGHALSCRAVGGKADRIVLWPLGGIAFCQPPMRPGAWLITTLCGPLVNAILWPVFYFICQAWHPGPGAPEASLYVYVGCRIMLEINKALLLFNLIPAYPMDGGRILQELLWFGVGLGRSLQISGVVGIVAGAAFVVLGSGLSGLKLWIPGLDFPLGGQRDSILMFIGLLCVVQSLSIVRVAWKIAAATKAARPENVLRVDGVVRDARSPHEIGPGGPG